MTDTTPSLQQRMALMPGWTTEVVIQAPRQLVWEQVTDFEAYSEWNPFVLEASAQFTVGQSVQFLEDLKQFGQHWLTAQFLAIAPPSSFVWQGHFTSPALFSVHHTFEFEAISDRQTRFRQVHKNSGLLVPFLAWRGVYWVSRQGYRDFDQALKARCEAISA
ncbi:MAG: SRPBCC domain-containing protein [Elainellaceae cyanobacterium]